MNRDPVSPMKMRAGCRLKNKKDSVQPKNKADKNDGALKELSSEKNIMNAKMTDPTPAARPSTPSVRLAQLTMPTTYTSKRK